MMATKTQSISQILELVRMPSAQLDKFCIPALTREKIESYSKFSGYFQTEFFVF
jgi:hypothetical protein